MAGMDPYYHAQHHFVRQPVSTLRDQLYKSVSKCFNPQLNYHLYTDATPTNSGRKFFIPDTLREDLQKRSEQIHLGPSPNIGLPEDVQGYHSLVPLEMPSSSSDREKRKGYGMAGAIQAILYKATKASDGKVYVLRRVESKFSRMMMMKFEHCR